MSIAKKVEHGIEYFLFTSRWIMAPIYLGLVVSLAGLMIKFLQELAHLIPHVLELHDADVVLGVLALLDLSFAANLIILVVFSGYENFVSRIDFADGVERPEWMGKVDFNNLKIKLISSVVAISGIHLLRVFMKIESYTDQQIMWLVVIHLTFVVSGVLMAFTDRLLGHGGGHHADNGHGTGNGSGSPAPSH